jgi:hypothetical protein
MWFQVTTHLKRMERGCSQTDGSVRCRALGCRADPTGSYIITFLHYVVNCLVGGRDCGTVELGYRAVLLNTRNR